MKDYILGVESTAHTFGVAVVKNKKILANEKASYITVKGGIIPFEAAKHHAQVALDIYNQALASAKIQEEEIKTIAFSQGPGLPPCLLEGKRFVKKLAEKLNVPVIPVNHCIAHLEIGKITGAKDPVLLYVSGANTQIIAYASGKYRIFGETLDTGAGNFIDTFARYAGIGFPGGPVIAKLAEKARKQKLSYIELPYSIKGMDVAFSGILTNLRQKLEKKQYSIEHLAFSLEETAFAMLVEAAERAMAHTNKKELLLGGGVACNLRLQEMCQIMCKERKAKFFCPPRELLLDNAGMIAFLGEIMFKKKLSITPGTKTFEELDILPRQRTDEVEVSWKLKES